MFEPLTPEEDEALSKYIETHGPDWKEHLLDDWWRARTTGVLQQMRNRRGPRWLDKYEHDNAPVPKKPDAMLALLRAPKTINVSKSYEYKGLLNRGQIMPHAHHMREALGLGLYAKLPREAMPPREVLGHTIFVTAWNPEKPRAHRVFYVCNDCHNAVPAGRSHQHKCKE